jgi:hypothetical protein
MAVKPVRGRRCRTFTVSSSVLKLPGAPVNAQLSVNPNGANNTLIWRSVKPGIIGNSLRVVYLSPGIPNQTLSVTFLNNVFTVNLATDGSSVITTTAQNILDLVNGTKQFGDVIYVLPSGTISGTADAVAIASLASGAEGTGDFLIPFSNARITVETQSIRLKSDTNDPATADGTLLPTSYVLDLTNPDINYRKYLENLTLIRATGSESIVSVEYLQY